MRRESGEDPGRSYQEEEEKEKDSILRAAGFDPTEEGWWAKGNVLFNREAALQVAQRELHKRGNDISPSYFWTSTVGTGMYRKENSWKV